MARHKTHQKHDNQQASVEVVKKSEVKEISWSFPEFEQHERGTAWYVWFGIVISALLVYAFWNFNLLFAFIIITASIAILIQHQRGPVQIDVKIDDDGISLENKTYLYQDIQIFWVIYRPREVKILYIKLKSAMSPTIGIPLGDNNPIMVRDFLKNYIEEDLARNSELVRDALSRVLKL